MSKGKLLVIVVSLALLSVLIAPQSQAWPSDDQGGPYYVQQVSSDDTPTVDGVIDNGEWNTEEEYFREIYDVALAYPGEDSITGLTLSIVMLRDANNENLYVKVTWENTVRDGDSPNSIGIAFAEQDPKSMAQTYDRKVAYWDGSSMNNTDLYNCRNVQTNVSEFCTSNPNYLQPGVPDTGENEWNATFGYDENSEKAFIEFRFPMGSNYDGFNATEDFAIGEGTYLEIIANPYDNISEPNIGHGGVGSAPLFIQYEERCFFCQPPEGIESNAAVFNGFFAIMISGIFLALIFSGRSEAIANKLWKVDVSEDMAKQSVIMEMAYYNSSFLSILISAFFLMYSLIALIYGLWAQWGVTGLIMNGIPTLLGIFAIYDLVNRNQNPQEMGEKPGVDVSEANNFWLVPTLFLAITLLMLVFIGIDVIA